MNFILVDPALKREVGYHASICHYLVPKLKTFGIKPIIFSNLNSSPALASSLDVNPLFRHCSEDLFRPDGYFEPDYGPAPSEEHFKLLWQATQEDLTRLQNVSAADCVYVNASGPVELMAAVQWLRTFPPKTRPRVIVQLEKPSRLDAPLLHCFGLRALLSAIPNQPAGNVGSLLKLFSFNAVASEFYEAELSHPVEVWPFPQEPITTRADRRGKRSHTIAILGHQTREKGFAIVPELASMLLANEDIVLLVHNNTPGEMPDEQAQLRAIAHANKRLILSESAVRSDVWRRFLEFADVVLCPQKGATGEETRSPVLNEAIANGIPAVVPKNSAMSQLLEAFGNPGSSFAETDVMSVNGAVRQVLDNYDHYAGVAHAASETWKASQGVGNLIGRLISWYPPPSPIAYAQQHADSSTVKKEPGVGAAPSVGKLRPKRLLVSWYCDPSYIPPPILSENQVTVGPHPLATARTYLAANERKRYDAYTPYKSLYDIKEVLETQGETGPFDAVIVFTESTLNNLPHNVEAFGCPTVLFVGDTHHSEGAIKNVVQYATKARFDYVVSTYNRQHVHWFLEAGKERVAWIPGLSVQHIPQRFRYRPARRRQLAFVGQTHTMHQRRARLVGALRAAEIPVEPKMVSRAEAANLYSSSVLSFNASLNGDLNLRTFEVMSAGGCLVTDRLSVESGQSILFEEGRDYLGYSSVDELTETVEQYLNRPEQALKIAASGNKEYLQRLLPETQAQVLLNWVFSGNLPSEYSSTWDIRPRVAALSSVPLLRRIEIYETLQEAHQIPEEIRVLVSSRVPLSVVADMIDLPRVRCSILENDHGIETLLRQFDLESRVSVSNSPDQAASLGPWDFVIAHPDDHPSVRDIPHRQYLEVQTDDRAPARLAG